jgi:hypothetical protein
MDGEAQGMPVPVFLWEKRGVILFLKVDKGLKAESDGVSLMRPMPELDAARPEWDARSSFKPEPPPPRYTIFRQRRYPPHEIGNDRKPPRADLPFGR